MESSNIRLAQEDDIEQLCGLNEEVQAIHVHLSPIVFKDTDCAEIKSWFKSIMDDSSMSILVAESAGEIIGYLILQKQIKPAHPFCNERKCAYIDQVCIGERYRGTGVFSLFMEEVATVARDWGMQSVELSVWSDNVNAKGAFMKAGFITYNEKMVKKLSG